MSDVYLHRGVEKLCEHRTYHQIVPITDRLYYISSFAMNHGFCEAAEKLMGLEVPARGRYIRTIAAEMSRLANHLLWLGSHALDVGAMTIFLYAFREREDLLDMYEAVSGARMHAAYYRPGGVYRDLPDTMPQYSAQITRRSLIHISEPNRPD